MKNVPVGVLVSALVLGTIIPVAGLDKGKKFKAERASTYPIKATQEKVTIAVVPYTDREEIKVAFGKADMLKHGVLPVLVVIDNDTGKALRVNPKCELIFADGQHIANTPADDVPHLYGAKRPTYPDQPSRYPIPLPKKKNDLAVWEVEGRAFSAKLIPPGESVSGFFYFQAQREPGIKLYFNGLSDASTGNDLFYWELPLDSK